MELVSAPPPFDPVPSFVLKMKGDSMIEHGILDGDLVIFQKKDRARDGELVMAKVGETLTFKSCAGDVVVGVAVGLMRRF